MDLARDTFDLAVKVDVDDARKKFRVIKGGFKDMSDAAKQTQRKIDREAKQTAQSYARVETSVLSLKGAMLGLGAAAIGGLAAAGVYDVLKGWNSAAMEAQETFNKFQVVFASISGEAQAVKDALALDYGLSEAGAAAYLAQIGDLLTGLGLAKEQALALAEQTVALGTDLASFSNLAGGTEQAVDALTKAMLGETEAAKALGVVLLEGQMEKYAAGLGLTWKELGLAEKAQLRLNAAIEQSPNAIGDFNRSMNSATNQMRIAQAMGEDLSMTLGYGLTGSVNTLLIALNGQRGALTQFAQVASGFMINEGQQLDTLFGSIAESSTNAEYGIVGLSSGFIQLAGGVKIVANSIALVIDGFQAIGVAGEQLGHMISALLNAATMNLDAAKEDMRLFAEKGVAMRQEIAGNIQDMLNGFDMMTNPEKVAIKFIEQYQKARQQIAAATKDQTKPNRLTPTVVTPNSVQSTATKKVEPDFAMAAAMVNADPFADQWLQYDRDKVKYQELVDNKKITQAAFDQWKTDAFNKVFDAEFEHYEQLHEAHVDMLEDREAREAEAAKKALQNSEDMLDGVKLGFTDMSKQYKSMAEDMASAMTSSMGGVEDALVNVARTGKFEFTDMANSIIADLTRIAVRQAVVKPMVGAIAGLFHDGGVAGAASSYMMVNPGVFSGAKRYHSGGTVLGSGEVPAILKAGEVVLNAAQQKNLASNIQGGDIIINNSFSLPTPSGDSQKDQAYLKEAAKAFERELDGVITEKLRQAQRPGGALNSGVSM